MYHLCSSWSSIDSNSLTIWIFCDPSLVTSIHHLLRYFTRPCDKYVIPSMFSYLFFTKLHVDKDVSMISFHCCRQKNET